MMYYYWKEKAIRPSVFNEIRENNPGEYRIIRAFFEVERDEEPKGSCPLLGG